VRDDARCSCSIAGSLENGTRVADERLSPKLWTSRRDRSKQDHTTAWIDPCALGPLA